MTSGDGRWHAHAASLHRSEARAVQGEANDVRGDRAQDGQQAGDGDPVRALQRKLYRAAKQSRNRRFHALFDKVHRKDVLWAAWVEVARNRGHRGWMGSRSKPSSSRARVPSSTSCTPSFDRVATGRCRSAGSPYSLFVSGIVGQEGMVGRWLVLRCRLGVVNRAGSRWSGPSAARTTTLTPARDTAGSRSEEAAFPQQHHLTRWSGMDGR
jgi:hypothetical protein